MSVEEGVGAELEADGDIAGGADNGFGTGMRDGGGGHESRARVECGERDKCVVATEGGINSVQGVAVQM